MPKARVGCHALPFSTLPSWALGTGSFTDHRVCHWGSKCRSSCLHSKFSCSFGFQQAHGINFYPDMKCHLIPITWMTMKIHSAKVWKFQIWQVSRPLTHDGSVDLRIGGAKSQTWQLDPTWYHISHRTLTGRWISGWMGRGALGSFQVLW